MKSIWIVSILLCISNISYAVENSSSSDAHLVWKNTGKCFALLEKVRQVQNDPASDHLWTAAVSRVQFAFVNASKSAGVDLDSSSPEAFYQEMRDYLVMFDSLVRQQDEEALSKLYDDCTMQFM